MAKKSKGTVWVKHESVPSLETTSAADNLGCSAMRWGPLYVDKYGPGSFFITVSLGDWWGLKLRLNDRIWRLETPLFELSGDWK